MLIDDWKKLNEAAVQLRDTIAKQALDTAIRIVDTLYGWVKGKA